jgi:hypothetical protein
MLQAARAGGYCIGAFNLVDFLTLKAIIEAAQEQRSPVMLQTSSATVKRQERSLMAHLADDSPVLSPCTDHGTDPAVVRRAIRCECTAAYDGSNCFAEMPGLRGGRRATPPESRSRAIGIVAGVVGATRCRQDAAITPSPTRP